MSIPDSIKAGTNPTHLPPRYEIRQLTEKHIPWASAIVIHSNMFHSPVWPVIYPVEKTRRFRQGMLTTEYLLRHQVDSGMSFGVFDTQFQYKRPESVATEGKLYFDENDMETDSATLLEQMDFPLVSIAMAYDGSQPLDMEKLMPLMGTLPLFGTLYHALEVADKRDPSSWKANGPREVLFRNATSTRADYEGQGIMKKMAQWLMREAALKGYRGIQIECAHDAVTHTWLHPPEPFQSELISSLDSNTWEQEEEDGKKTHPFRPSKQVFTKIYVTLSVDQKNETKVNGHTTAGDATIGALG